MSGNDDDTVSIKSIQIKEIDTSSDEGSTAGVEVRKGNVGFGDEIPTNGESSASAASGVPHRRLTLSKKDSEDTFRSCALIRAVLNLDLDKVTKCLDEGASPNASCQGSEISVCHLAAFLDAPDILQLLISRGGDALTRPDKRGRSPLHLAAWQGNYNCVATLLKQPRVGGLVKTCITEAEYEENTQRLLFEMRPHILSQRVARSQPGKELLCSTFGISGLLRDVISKIEEVWTDSSPFDLASARTHPLLVELFLEAIEMFVDYDKIIARALLKCGTAYMKDLAQCSQDRLLETLELFERRGIMEPIEKCEGSPQGDSSFHVAVMLDSELPICCLSRMDFWPTLMNAEGDTPIHLAIKQKKEKSLMTMFSLFRLGDYLEMRNKDQETALMVAISTQWKEAVTYLLDFEADVSSCNSQSKNCLHLVIDTNNSQLFELVLVNASFLESSRCQAVLDHVSEDKLTPLLLAIKCGYESFAIELISSGASCSVTGCRQGFTALHMATQCQQYKTVQYLINHQENELNDDEALRAFVNQRDVYGLSALYYAVQCKDCTKALINAGADVQIKGGANKFTALHNAVTHSHMETTELILRKDKQAMNIKDNNKMTPFHSAVYKGNREMAKLFLHHGANFAEAAFDPDKTPKFNYLYTVVNLMLKYTPRPIELLLEFFDSKLTMQGCNLNANDACSVRIDYSSLFLPYGKTETFEDAEPVKYDAHSAEEAGVLLPEAVQPLAAARDCRQMNVLHVFMSCCDPYDQKCLLLHPYLESFLRMKWSKMKYLYYLVFLLNLLFAVFYTCLIRSIFLKQHTKDALDSWILTYKVLVGLFMSAILVLKLMVSRSHFILHRKPPKWRGLTWTQVRGLTVITMLSLSFLTLVLPEDWLLLRLVCCINILLTWFEATATLSRFPGHGYFFQMFTMVTSRICKVFFLFGAAIVISFGLLFWMTFGGQAPFASPYLAIVKSVVMMNSEFDYGSMFEAEDWPLSIYVGHFCLLVNIILVPIAMMNLLLALAVSDTNDLNEEGRAQRLREHAVSLASYENVCSLYFPSLLKRICVDEVVTIKPDRRQDRGALPQRIINSIYECVKKTKASQDMEKTMQELKSRVHGVELKVDKMNSSLERLVDLLEKRNPVT